MVLHFDTMTQLASWFAAYVAEGSVRLKRENGASLGSEFGLSLELADGAKFGAKARVVEVGLGELALCTLTPRPDLVEALAHHALSRRSGRYRPPGPRRKSERYDIFLKANFRSSLQMATEFVTNMSRGGLFVRTRTPPELGSSVAVDLTLSDGRVLQVHGHVVRIVDEAEAAANGSTPGAGIVLDEAEGFAPTFEALVQEHLDRPRRVLIVDDDRFFLRVLADQLLSAGIEVATAGGGPQAAHKLVDLFYDLDAVVLDLHMPTVDGRALMERIRRFGHEMDLRIAVVSAAEDVVLAQLVGPGKADIALSKALPVDELGKHILALLR